MAQQPGFGVAGVDVAFNPDDGRHVRMPVGIGQLVSGIEDGDGATFVAVAALVVAVGVASKGSGDAIAGKLAEGDPSGVVVAEMSWIV